MGFHVYPLDRADNLEDVSRFRFCSPEELLGTLAPHEDMVVADLGSGTGFFTDFVAPHVDTVYAVDLQEGMHDRYREKGIPENVEPITADVADLDDELDGIDAAYSVDTYHEYHSDASLEALKTIIKPGGRIVTFDWSANGDGIAGPPLDERFALGDAVSHFSDAGFTIEEARERPETFVCVARR